MTFAPSEGGTKVTLVHANWERLGDEGPGTRKGYAEGWITVLDGAYAAFVRA